MKPYSAHLHPSKLSSAMQFVWRFLDAHGPAVQGGAAIIQASAAVVTVFVTVWLVRITRGYAQTAQNALTMSREQFELYGTQFDREWSPDVHVQAVKSEGSSAELEVTNLGRTAVVITRLHIKFTDQEKARYVRDIPRPFPLASGTRSRF